jgi:hypothetical protein
MPDFPFSRFPYLPRPQRVERERVAGFSSALPTGAALRAGDRSRSADRAPAVQACKKREIPVGRNLTVNARFSMTDFQFSRFPSFDCEPTEAGHLAKKPSRANRRDVS